MKKYQVFVVRAEYYEFEISAKSFEEAEKQAKQIPGTILKNHKYVSVHEQVDGIKLVKKR